MSHRHLSHPLGPVHRGIAESDRPSIQELLTIVQCGFPRTYNLNDGMGLDLAPRVPVPEVPFLRVSLDLERVGS